MKKLNLLLILFIGLLVVGCSGEAEPVETTTQEEVVKSVNITTQEIIPSEFASYVRVVGTVETSNDIMISAEVSGKILSYSVSEGGLVKKGQTILQIDDSKLKQEKARLEAMTEQAKDSFTRLEKVYKEDGIGSESGYLAAKYTFEQSNSALESIKVDLANTKIKAPFNGRIESKTINVGEMVNPGMSVVRLIGSDDFKISAGVPARYADVISQGDNVDIWFDTERSDTMNTSISFAANSIDPKNRTFKIEISLPKSESYKVDMITNVRLKTYAQENVVVISEEFVYSKNSGYVVYVLSANDEGKPVAKERIVKLGKSYKSDVIVSQGLEIGDQLITLGSAFLDDGMRVTPKETPTRKLAIK